MSSQGKKINSSKKPTRTTPSTATPPITRHKSKHNLKVTSPLREQNQSQLSDFLYQSASQPSNHISLTTPDSQTKRQNTESPSMNSGTTYPSKSESDLDDRMEEDESIVNLSASIGKINLSGILNKTLEGTSQMLRMLEEEETITTNIAETEHTSESFFEEKAKKLKSSLIILAKASHHRTFMETCLNAKTPPRNMCLWVEPHIYHSSREVKKEWRDTLATASLKLLTTLIKHHTKVIEEEKQTLETTIFEVTTKLKHTTKK